MNKKTDNAPVFSEEVRNVHNFYDTVLSSLIDGIVVVDRQFRIQTFSATSETMTGVKAETVQGRKLTQLFEKHSVIHTLVKKSFETGRSFSDSSFSIHGYFRDRTDIGLAVSPMVDHTGKTVGVVIVFRDLSQIKSLEERLRKGERLTSLGILSAGMAHEIKNPLGGIRGAAQLLQGELTEGHALGEHVKIIIREVDRLNKIVLGLLEFSSPPALKMQSMNLHQVLNRVISLVQMEVYGENVHWARNYDPSLPEVTGDPDQLIQVFLNLLKNGIEAMDRDGTLTLTTRILPGYRIETGAHGKEGMLAVDIEDTGCGIAPGDIGKVFDPFYTSKSEGVGLGLALSHQIVAEHGGKIEVSSKPGKGTRFRVCIPIALKS